MHSLPSVFLRQQSLRSNLTIAAKWTLRQSSTVTTTTLVTAVAGPPPTRPGRTRYDTTATTAAAGPVRSFAICARCRFRVRPSVYYPGGPNNEFVDKEKEKIKDEKQVNETLTQAEEEVESGRKVDDGKTATSSPPSSSPGREESGVFGDSHGQNQPHSQNPGANSTKAPTTSRRLPSNMENRRSQLSKQFTSLMDNLQSNVFVAGQRLNDLTGYSAIEALKREIQEQENRVRETRTQVRNAKSTYSAAINRRSTSQREVNELLQRKHAWSAADLERFTHLYRNDHANEVAETEAQEALSLAERQAEEAAASLSKSILSRYHEEQVWSDKIRRMSTWGTWGLMGVNVLLFLVFQIAVEPWRRRRLVKGFEEKVIEALEKEKKENGSTAAGDVALGLMPDQHGEQVLHATSVPVVRDDTTSATAVDGQSTPESPPTDLLPKVTIEESTSETSPPTTISDTTSSTPTQTKTTAAHPSEEPTISPHHHHHRLSFPPGTSSTSSSTWRQACQDLFSERLISISQRELTTAVIQSAAAGAALTGLLIALIRPR